MPTACPHCRFEVEVAPGFGAATCPACNNVINEADVFPGLPPEGDFAAAAPAAPVDMSLPPEEEMPGGFLANASDFIGDPSGALAEPAVDRTSLDEMTLALDSSSLADAANSADAGYAPETAGVAEEGANFLASNSDFIAGPGEAPASAEGDLALDVASSPPADPSVGAWDPGTVFPANDGNVAEAAWDSTSSAPPVLESPVGTIGDAAGAEAAWDPNAAPDPNAAAWDPNAAPDPNAAAWDPNAAPDPNAAAWDPTAAPAEAAWDPNAAPAEAAWDPNAAPAEAAWDPNAAAEGAYDPNAPAWDPNTAPAEAAYDPTAAPLETAAPVEEWAAPPDSGDPLAGGAVPDPAEEDPYSGLPVNWENSAPGLPISPRSLPTVNEDGSPHDEAAALAVGVPAPRIEDDAFFAAPAPPPEPALDPPPMRAAVAPPPPPAAASLVGAAPAPLPAPPPPSPRVQVELEAAEPDPPAGIPTIKPDAPGTPAPSFAPQRVVSEIRVPERPLAVERARAPSPAPTPAAPWASTPSPAASAPSAVAKPVPGAIPAGIPGTRSRAPLYFGGAALALLVVGGGGFGLMKAFGGGDDGLPVATPNPIAMISSTPAPIETVAVVEPTAESTPEATPTAAASVKTPNPAPTPVVKLTPTPAPTKVAVKTPVPTPTKVAVAAKTPTPAQTATARPAATPMPSTTMLAMTAATPTPKPAPTSQGSSFLDAAPVQSTVKSTAGSRFGANPNVDMRDARYQALEAGHKMLDAWKTDDASKQYKKIVKANDTFADGHYWYAYASALQGETDRACKEFNRYLVLAPSGYYAKNARMQIKNCN